MVIIAIKLENLEYLFMICGNIMFYQQRNMLLKAFPTKNIFLSHPFFCSWLHNHCTYRAAQEK